MQNASVPDVLGTRLIELLCALLEVPTAQQNGREPAR